MRPTVVAMILVFLSGPLHADGAGTIFSVSSGDNVLRLVRVSSLTTLSTLSMTVTGGSIVGVHGIARHPVTDDVYIVGQTTGFGHVGRTLLNVDLITGVATVIGDTGFSPAGIVFDDLGVLHAVSGNVNSSLPGWTASSLAILDLNDATPTFIHNSLVVDNGRGLAYSSANSTFLIGSGNSDGGYVNGYPNPASPTVPPGLFEVSALLSCGTDDLLLAQFGSLYQIDSVTGSFTSLGNLDHSTNGMILADLDGDLSVESIDSPVNSDACAFGQAEVVSATVLNLGAATLPAGTTVPSSYSVNGGAPVTESLTLTAPLASGQTATLTFSTPVDLSSGGSFNLEVSIAYAPDPVGQNNSAMSLLSSPAAIATFPWTESFDGVPTGGASVPPADWAQSQDDGGADWRFSAVSPPSGNGPFDDHTTPNDTGTGAFAYIEDSTSEGSEAAIALLTPCFDVSALATPVFSFWVNANDAGAEQNPIAVDVLHGTAVTTDVIAQIGETAGAWRRFAVNLTPFSGGPLRLRLRGRNDNPSTPWNGESNDIGIDDCMIEDVVALGAGQAPQAGVATFDANGAVESNGYGVEAGLPGPYAASVASPGVLTMTFDGAPHQGVILLTGPLNPGVLPVPPFGQLDLGILGPGSITGLAILADGNTGSSLIDFLFKTDVTGRAAVSFSVPIFLAGSSTDLQAILFHPVLGFGFSNAVTLNFL